MGFIFWGWGGGCGASSCFPLPSLAAVCWAFSEPFDRTHIFNSFGAILHHLLFSTEINNSILEKHFVSLPVPSQHWMKTCSYLNKGITIFIIWFYTCADTKPTKWVSLGACHQPVPPHTVWIGYQARDSAGEGRTGRSYLTCQHPLYEPQQVFSLLWATVPSSVQCFHGTIFSIGTEVRPLMLCR